MMDDDDDDVFVVAYWYLPVQFRDNDENEDIKGGGRVQQYKREE